MSVIAAWMLAATACSDQPHMNPSFPLSISDARKAIGEMADAPRPFARPVLVVAGYLDPGVGCSVLASALRRFTTQPEQVIEVPLFTTTTFDACRRRLIETVSSRYPSSSPDQTAEVDVVAISMGGLASRYAAAPSGTSLPQLNVHTLYTVATPHRGAALAAWPSFDQRHLDMRAGSAFLDRLDEDLGRADYELVPYVRLGDMMVGAENAAPVGRAAWWLPNRAFQPPHLAAHTDPRILADIVRRLRGEQPFTVDPPAPLPD